MHTTGIVVASLSVLVWLCVCALALVFNHRAHWKPHNYERVPRKDSTQ